MKITLLTVGTRGDVQPYVALGRGLRAAGHTVCLCTHARFEPFVREHGLGFAPLAGDPQTLLKSEAGQRWLEGGNNPLRYARRLLKLAGPLLDQVLADTGRACQDADVILPSVFGLLAAYHVVEKTGQPLILAFLQQIHPTRYYPIQLAPLLPLGGRYNRLTYRLTAQAIWQVSRRAVNRARRKVLGLRPLAWAGPFDGRFYRDLPTLYGFSPHVVPPPPEWGPNVHVTGYWFLDRPPDFRPPADLVAFLEAGPPPVYVGFGSMLGREPQALTGLVLEALKLAGQRGILLGGWGGLEASNVPESVFQIDAIPHDWLFPQMAAVVHHGGAGTTAAGLRAGVPSILTPIFGDQPFWAWRVQQLGAGPRAIPQRRLTARKLATAIDQAVHDATMRQRAAELGEKIRAEEGVGQAVQVVEHLLKA